jgi:hypothetical protein
MMSSILLFMFIPGNKKATPKSYENSLKELIANIQTLRKTIGVPEDMHQIGQDLDVYQAYLKHAENSCQRLIKLKQPDSSDRGKGAGTRITGICEDLILVTRYSSNLQERLHDYLLLSDAEWPKADTPEFKKRLSDVTEVIAKTRSNLEYLDNSKIQDPALDELLYQVKFAQDIANKVKNAGDNHDEAQKQVEELRIQLARDRTDFLAARQYFWNNTVGIEQLLKALSSVQTTLSEPTGPIRLQQNIHQ